MNIMKKPVEGFTPEFYVRPLILFPIGRLNDFFDFGFGAAMGLSFNRYRSNSIVVTTETGYLRWRRHYEKVDSDIFMIPAVFSIGYKFHFTEKFSLTPLIGGGGIFISEKCYKMIMGYEPDRALEPIFKGSMSFDYSTAENFSVSIGAGFNSIYRKDKISEHYKFKNFIEAQVGLSYRIR